MRSNVGRCWIPSKHSHPYTGSWFERRAHMHMDLVIREFEAMRLQQPANHKPRLRLTKCRADTGSRPSYKRDVGKGRGLAPVGETFRAKIFCLLRKAWVSVREINRIKHPL